MNDLSDPSTIIDRPVPDSPRWPQEAFPLKEVQSWVRSILGLSEAIDILPSAIYASYQESPDLRLTARLSLIDQGQTSREVVFKGSLFPLLSGSLHAHALVSRHCMGMVPHLIGWEKYGGEGGSYFLYEPFKGRPIGDDRDPALLIETARTMARIQQRVAASGEAEETDIPHIDASDIPALFDSVCSSIDRHRSAWDGDEEGKLSKWLGFPAAHILDVLADVRPLIVRCAEEVTSLNLPATIDHGDLHDGNAIIQEDGTVLIYDWETATIGCPLFSLERLIVAAWRFDENPEGCGPWGYIPDTPTQSLIRDAYLDSLDRTDIAEPVFAAAMCLATIKEMYAEIQWADHAGWPDGNPEWTAQLICRMRFHLHNACRASRTFALRSDG